MKIWFEIGKRLLPQLTWSRGSQEKVVYLTFDDGPHPTITPWVMDELAKVGAKATFFAVGDNVRKFPQIAKQVVANGHRLENHTMHHVKGWRMNETEYLDEIQQCADVLKSDVENKLFRPPFGQINLKAIDRINENYEVIMWDVLTKDYLKGLDISKAQKRMQKDTVAGSIVVFHDSQKAEENLRSLLSPYLQFLKSEGYRMKAL